MDIFNFFHLNFILQHLTPQTLLILFFLEEAGVPLPISGDILLLTEGERSLLFQTNFGLVVLMVMAGVVGGSSVLYFLARFFGRALLVRFGRFVHLDEKRLTEIEKLLVRNEGLAIIVGRLIPGFRTATSVVAGVFRVPYWAFVLYTTVASIIWASVYFYLGRTVGTQWPRLIHLFFSRLALMISASVFIVLLIVLVLKKRKS